LSFSNKRIPKEKWLPKKLWNDVLRTMPIACVDIIFQRSDLSILYGFRLIKPYANVWALVGGRVLRGENLHQCASRIGNEYGLHFEKLNLNGVYPVTFPNRSDVVISLVARNISGQPLADGYEFSKFKWAPNPPRNLGANYLRMVKGWQTRVHSQEFLKHSQLP
jgi:ADP-ribose pyrophosphatase YjhB (NUDIX family)